MATQTPVIAADNGGMPELVEDGVTGYLYPPGNAVELAGRMKRFIDDRNRIREFGAAAFRRIRACTFQNQIQQILQVYRETGAIL
jgi:glycosyltransferase involved in cell wall biosynthesis